MLKSKGSRSLLLEAWPPKWFFSYSNLSVLLMTFFIVLSTMFSLNVPIYFLKDQQLQQTMEENLTESRLLQAPWEEDSKQGPGGGKEGSGGQKAGQEQKPGGQNQEKQEENGKLDELENGENGNGANGEEKGIAIKLTDEEKDILAQVDKLDTEAIYKIIDISVAKGLAEKMKRYVKERKLEDFILIEEQQWKVKITPAEPFFFDKASDRLKSQAKQLLDELGLFLSANPLYYIKIEGHTDNIPIKSQQFRSNWELSVARANSVMRYLIDADKLPIQRIQAVGYGEFRPVASNNTEEGRARNRRVVLEIVPITTNNH